MKMIKIFAVLVILLLTASAASAAHTSHTWKHNHKHITNPSNEKGLNYCENGECSTAPVDPGSTSDDQVSPSDKGESTTYQLCKDRTCTVGGNGKVLTLTNYKNAKDPTYDQLLKFLKADKTDEKPYTSTYVCSDFAKKLHDNAEKAGIKAGWVGCHSVNHAFNVFKTTDKGTVYIDCTGVPGGRTLQDKQLNCVKGKPLTGKYLFREDWKLNSMGTVKDLEVFW
jgi:hypothetical protein